MLKAMSKFQSVLKMFMLGVLKTILKTMLKYEKNTITLYGTCWNWAADFVFLLRFCTSNWSETYFFRYLQLLMIICGVIVNCKNRILYFLSSHLTGHKGESYRSSHIGREWRRNCSHSRSQWPVYASLRYVWISSLLSCVSRLVF